MTSRTTKIAVAREQLEDGVALFLAKRYISSLALLGAAEEILARVLEGSTGKHPLESTWAMANNIRAKLGHPHISKTEVFRIFNAGRNAIKHHTPGETLKMSHDRFGEAFEMIQRATWCAHSLKLRYKGKKEYREWYKESGFGNPWARTK